MSAGERELNCAVIKETAKYAGVCWRFQGGGIKGEERGRRRTAQIEKEYQEIKLDCSERREKERERERNQRIPLLLLYNDNRER